MKNVLFRAIQQNRPWSSHSNFSSVDAAIFAKDGKGRSAEALLFGTGYAFEMGYGQAHYVAVWERPNGDRRGNGYLLFKNGPTIQFVPVPIDELERIEQTYKRLSLDELISEAKAIVNTAPEAFDLTMDSIHRYPIQRDSRPPFLADEPDLEAMPWSDDELRASVEAYLDMQKKQRRGEKFIKKQYYADLAKQFGRSEKAFEYRMQNISYVLSIMGREWLDGLKPAKNVGANVAASIEKIIADLEGQIFIPVAAFEAQVKSELDKKDLPKPSGSVIPAKSTAIVTQFSRDPKVKGWVLKAAGQQCECCQQPAPFTATDGTPYLEVHHLRRLADGGSDTVTNAIALCPNCHRELHFGGNKGTLIEKLYVRLDRLVRE